MNLPAVILFICFSAAYGLKCKDGGDSFDHKTGKKSSVSFSTKECENTDKNVLCHRTETTWSGKSNEHTVSYYCPDRIQGKPCTTDQDGKCYDSEKKEGEYNQKVTTCCSSDEFKNAPATSSSAVSTRALLAIITALVFSA